MPEIIEQEDGTSKEFFTAEEVQAKATEAAQAEAARISTEKDAEIERLKKISNEKTENFRKYNEMTQEERDAHSANELSLIQRGDKLEAELGKITQTLEEKERNEREQTKTTALKNLHGELPEVKERLESSYAALAGMPETTPEEIQARALAAGRLAGISVDSQNPLYQPTNGEPPMYREKKEYIETTEGKVAADLARQALGLPEEKK